MQLHIRYTFRADGSFMEEDSDVLGNVIKTGGGRYECVGDQVTIEFAGGSTEQATLRWVSADRLHYTITGHTDMSQIWDSYDFRRDRASRNDNVPIEATASQKGLQRLGYSPARCLLCASPRPEAAKRLYSDRKSYGLCEECGQCYRGLCRLL